MPTPFPQDDEEELVGPMAALAAGSDSTSSTTAMQAIPKFLTPIKQQQAKTEEPAAVTEPPPVVSVSGVTPASQPTQEAASAASEPAEEGLDLLPDKVTVNVKNPWADLTSEI